MASFFIKHERINKSYFYLILSVSLIVFLVLQFLKKGYSPDDTFIYLQYARNLANGNGLSFNAGEPSYGITSPLWAIILSIPYFLKINGFWFAKYLDLFFAILSIAVFFKLVKIVLLQKLNDLDLLKSLQIISTSIFMINIWFIRWAFTGMETSLAVFCILSIFYLYLKEDYFSSYVLLSFFYLIRPESIVLFFVLTFFLFVNKVSIKDIILFSLIYIIILATFLVIAQLYFGTYVPNTALGKTSFNIGFNIYFEQLKRIFGTISYSSIIELILCLYVIIYLLYKKNLKIINLIFLIWFF